ncbi:MAG: 3-keto-5-aminohexanoate cleavage protein [Peptococcaceae bacterium]|jgi:uncharacterized protein (DUF849 family)|nr:3-keto-5-aminohexanoate cleavage protein [Peptococcaceae bacterium]
MDSKYRKYEEAEPQWSTPVIIESHINGLRTKEYNPNIPVGYVEIAADAIKCWEAGSCGIHVHNSSIRLIGEAAYEDYMKAMRPVMEKYPDVFWYSTNTDISSQGDDLSGIEHVELLAQKEGVSVCCIDCGSANLPFSVDSEGHISGGTYLVPYGFMNRQVDLCNRNHIGIVWGIYEPGYLRTALQYTKTGHSPKGSSIDLYFLGDYGSLAKQPINTCGVPPTIESLYFYLNLMEGCKLPWFISIWGEGSQDTRPLIKRVIELGGHIKTGLELHFDPECNPTNVELLAVVQDIAREVGRPLARQDEVRAILGLE